jgi:hypothetical protein
MANFPYEMNALAKSSQRVADIYWCELFWLVCGFIVGIIVFHISYPHCVQLYTRSFYSFSATQSAAMLPVTVHVIVLKWELIRLKLNYLLLGA